MKPLFTAALCAVLSVAAAQPAHAAPPDADHLALMLNLCIDGGPPGARNRACSNVIKYGTRGFTNLEIAAAYNFRAIQYYTDQQYDLALADVDQAIALLPDDPKLANLRTMILAKKAAPAQP